MTTPNGDNASLHELERNWPWPRAGRQEKRPTP